MYGPQGAECFFPNLSSAFKEITSLNRCYFYMSGSIYVSSPCCVISPLALPASPSYSFFPFLSPIYRSPFATIWEVKSGWKID